MRRALDLVNDVCTLTSDLGIQIGLIVLGVAVGTLDRVGQRSVHIITILVLTKVSLNGFVLFIDGQTQVDIIARIEIVKAKLNAECSPHVLCRQIRILGVFPAENVGVNAQIQCAVRPDGVAVRVVLGDLDQGKDVLTARFIARKEPVSVAVILPGSSVPSATNEKIGVP